MNALRNSIVVDGATKNKVRRQKGVRTHATKKVLMIVRDGDKRQLTEVAVNSDPLPTYTTTSRIPRCPSKTNGSLAQEQCEVHGMRMLGRIYSALNEKESKIPKRPTKVADRTKLEVSDKVHEAKEGSISGNSRITGRVDKSLSKRLSSIEARIQNLQNRTECWAHDLRHRHFRLNRRLKRLHLEVDIVEALDATCTIIKKALPLIGQSMLSTISNSHGEMTGLLSVDAPQRSGSNLLSMKDPSDKEPSVLSQWKTGCLEARAVADACHSAKAVQFGTTSVRPEVPQALQDMKPLSKLQTASEGHSGSPDEATYASMVPFRAHSDLEDAEDQWHLDRMNNRVTEDSPQRLHSSSQQLCFHEEDKQKKKGVECRQAAETVASQPTSNAVSRTNMA